MVGNVSFTQRFQSQSGSGSGSSSNLSCGSGGSTDGSLHHEADACGCCEAVSQVASILNLEHEIGSMSFRCPITQEVMQDPVICEDGHTYERAAIERWLTQSNRSPQTNLPLSSRKCIPNYALRSAIHELCIKKVFRKDGDEQYGNRCGNSAHGNSSSAYMRGSSRNDRHLGHQNHDI